MISGLTAIGLIFAVLKTVTLAAPSGINFQLKNTCPPSFEKDEDGTCRFRSLYQLYASPPGFGGLRVPLPDPRDGFTPQQIDLGRYLFFDRILSGDKATSCSQCHRPEDGFTDGLPRSQGIGGIELPRAAPTLWNVGFLKILFWDGRAKSLEQQAEGPLFNPDEMGNTRESLEKSLNDNAIYCRLFARAFPNSNTTKITVDQVTSALAAFESSLISLNSRYDRYAHGDNEALSEQEIKGHNVFRSFVARCSQCHTPPLFTNGQLAVTGAPEPDNRPLDAGAQDIFGDKTLRGAFKVPTLRNTALTAPYMHSGSFDTLKDVIDFYNGRRGHAVPKGEDVKINWHILEPRLNPQEIDALVRFLSTLTDESMMPEIPVAVPSGLTVIRRRS